MNMDMSIKIKMPRRRCVLVINRRQEYWQKEHGIVDQQPGWCLGFFQSADGADNAEPLALVELEDGSIKELAPSSIKFVDQDEMKEEEPTTEAVATCTTYLNPTKPFGEFDYRCDACGHRGTATHYVPLTCEGCSAVFKHGGARIDG